MTRNAEFYEGRGLKLRIGIDVGDDVTHGERPVGVATRSGLYKEVGDMMQVLVAPREVEIPEQNSCCRIVVGITFQADVGFNASVPPRALRRQNYVCSLLSRVF